MGHARQPRRRLAKRHFRRGPSMCVVAMAWKAHPQWTLVLAGNRDEFHARPTAPLGRRGAVIGGQDLLSGGMWLGVSEAGRFAVVTNVAGGGPDPSRRSRGALVADWLEQGSLPDDPDAFNPYSLIAGDMRAVERLTNRPAAQRHPLSHGLHSVSNGMGDEPWPRRERLEAGLRCWLEAEGETQAEGLFGLLMDESAVDASGQRPVFIRSQDYGTRASSVILIDAAGQGRMMERRFGPEGAPQGQTEIAFRWPAGDRASLGQGEDG